MKVLFAVAEADPFAKTGGLGDVGGSLPLAVNQGGCLMTVIMPKYKKIPASLQESMVHIADFTVNLGWRKQGSVLWATEYQGVSYYFIDNEYYFYRDDIYGYDDDKERFAFFSQGVLESILYLKDDKPDILHCNDWHTALIPVMLREHYRDNSFYRGIKTLLTVHNIKHQGIFSKELLGDLLGMREDSLGARSLKFQNAINFFKGGLLTADVISTVSPSYAREIMQPEYGEGLEDIIKKRKDSLSGILNGIDYNKYNPYTDPALTAHYPSPGWKKKNKEELQRYLKLTVEEGVPLFAIVSRLVDQKGLDLLEPIMDEILSLDLQMVVLGTGEKKYEEMFHHFACKYPSKLAAMFIFHEELARKIYGGADLLLMPSCFEPCGLAQMMAMRYGTIPLVRETGGLKDSIIPFDPDTGFGNGFTFKSYKPEELLSAMKKAVTIYRDQKAWTHLQERAMETDFSWAKSAQKYIDLYQDIMRRE